MIVVCAGCQTRFTVPDDRLKPPETKVRCSRCGSVFGVRPAAGGSPVAGSSAASPRPVAASPSRGPGAERLPPLRLPPLSPPTPSPAAASGPRGLAGEAAADPFAHLELGAVSLDPASSVGGPGLLAPPSPVPRTAASLASPPPASPAGPRLSGPARPAGGAGAGELGGGLAAPGPEPELELETFGANAARPRPVPPRELGLQTPSSPRIQAPSKVAAAEVGEGRVIAFPAAAEGELTLDTSSVGERLAPGPRLASEARRPALPGNPLPASGVLPPGRESGARTGTSLPPLTATTVSTGLLRPPLGLSLLTALLTLTTFLLLLLGFLAIRNGGVLDLRQPGRLFAVAFGSAAPTRLLGDGPARLVGVRPLLYATSTGQELVLVEGEILNVGLVPLRRVRVQVRLLDASTGRLLHSREVPAGVLPKPAQLAAIDGKSALDQLFFDQERASEGVLLQPGQRVFFLAPFLGVEGTLPSLVVESRVSEIREVAARGAL
ncbi:MAG: zinc-ribbon domain-containing protein [Myxococcota bacterium]|jgi:predicted Zn finger-like uncharacterized protein|nr:zinc-ribbon domain-containing protein [Myxococcota bacterium]